MGKHKDKRVLPKRHAAIAPANLFSILPVQLDLNVPLSGLAHPSRPYDDLCGRPALASGAAYRQIPL
jgi:hypothetical protein